MSNRLRSRSACIVLASAWAAGAGCLGEAYALTADDGLDASFAFKTEAGVSSASDGIAWEADADIGLAWAPRPNVELAASIEARNSFGGIRFAEAANAMGSFTGLADGVGGGPLLRVPKVWLRWSFAGQSSLTFGRLHFEDTLSANAVSSSSATAFTNEAFSAKPAIAFPKDSFGVALTLGLTDRLISRFVVGDADRDGEFGVFETGAVFGAVELEAVVGVRENPGRLRATIWSREAPQANDFGGVGGVALSADYPVGASTRLMLRYHHADDGAGVLREGAAFAVVVPAALMGRPADRFGVGAGLFENAGGASQVTAETFYRWQINDHVALTPVLQLLFKEEGAQDGFFGVRLRYAD